jgi:hypothetical protein
MPEPTRRASGARTINETGPPVSGKVEEAEAVAVALAVAEAVAEVVALAVAVEVAEGLAVLLAVDVAVGVTVAVAVGGGPRISLKLPTSAGCCTAIRQASPASWDSPPGSQAG